MEVSIIVIAYNEALYIRKCIMGILNQTIPDFELLIVDDCSTDGTAGVIKEIYDTRIRYIRNLQTYGVTESRNIGIRQAKGIYIFFTDADCIPTRYWLEEGLKILKEKKCVGVEGRTFYATARTAISDRIVEDMEGRYHSTNNITYTKKVLDKVGGFNSKYVYYEDVDLGFRIKKYGDIVFSENMIVMHQRKIYTIKKLFKDARRSKSAVRLIKNYPHWRDKNIIWHRVLYPKKLLILLFPFLLIPYHSFRSWEDIKLLPFIYFSSVYLRLLVWKEAIKERILLI